MSSENGGSEHDCTWRDEVEWSDWRRDGSRRVRDARRIPTCTACGVQRSSRRPRVVFRAEVESGVERFAPVLDAAGRVVACELVRRTRLRQADELGPAIPVRGLFSALAKKEIAATSAEQVLDLLVDAGYVRLCHALRGASKTLASVLLDDVEALEELAQPGLGQRRRAAIDLARRAANASDHPFAKQVGRLLGEEPRLMSPDVAIVLGALVPHVAAGDVVAERVFSTQHLGDSKALARLRRQVEALVGPLGELGIRDGGTATLIGGRGRLVFPSCAIDLAVFQPFVGLPLDVIETLTDVAFPEAGLFLVENFTVFEACCRREIEDGRDTMLVWTAGFPRRATRRLVERAGRCSVRIRMWADLDLAGVHIARLVAGWARGGFEPHRMGPADVEFAPVSIPLDPTRLSALERDLGEKPHDILSDTVAKLVEMRAWVEQECFLIQRAVTACRTVLGRG